MQFSFWTIIEDICISGLQVLSIRIFIIFGSIEKGFTWMVNHDYHWTQENRTHHFIRRCKAHRYRECKFRYFMLASYSAQAARGLCVNSPRGLTIRLVLRLHLFRRRMYNGTPWPCSGFNHETPQKSNDGIPLLMNAPDAIVKKRRQTRETQRQQHILWEHFGNIHWPAKWTGN